MSKDERILKKVGKLLKLYGVSDEEKDKFLIDLQDKKYDDEEEPTEETSEEVLEENKQEEVVENKDEKLEEQPGEEKQPEVNDEKVEEKVEEKPGKEEFVEEGKEEIEEGQFDYKAQYEELKKSNDGLSARIQALEDIVAELGVEKKEDKTVGANPNGNAVDETYNSAFDEINRKRVG